MEWGVKPPTPKRKANMLLDYIVITNKADEVSRIALEKLGFSTKRNDDNTIGQFGSGIKYAPIAALRKGLEWFFTGYDKNGPFTLRYVVEEEDGIDCVVYQYDDYKKSSSFTLDAGILSWEDPFQILREPIANAMDNAKIIDNGWYNVCVITVNTDDETSMEKLKPVEGQFSVYISASPELMSIIKKYDNYFSVNRNVLADMCWGKILEKIDSDSRFYCKNILVKTDQEYHSIFDYQIDDIELNEERTIKTLWDLDWAIVKIIGNTTDEKVIEKYLEKFIDADTESDIWELARLSTLSQSFEYHINEDARKSWIDVWNKMTDGKGIIVDGNFNSDSSILSITQRGYKPVIVKNRSALNIMKAFNFKNVTSILGEHIDYETDFDTSKYPKLTKAIDIATYFEPGLFHIRDKIATFKTKKESVLGMLITNENKERIIVIDESHANYGSVSEIVATIIHEYDHYSSGINDSHDIAGKKFRDLADTRIGKLMTDFYKDSIFEEAQGGVIILNKNTYFLDNFKYLAEYSKTLNAYIVNVGNNIVIVNANAGAIDPQGVCQITSDGDGIYFPVRGAFSIGDINDGVR